MSRRKPWNPQAQVRPTEFSEQLGFPNPQRAKQSKAGFEPEQLAVGAQRDGVVRSRERSMLTPPELLADRLASKTQAYTDKGTELPKDGIRVQETPSDRVTAMHRGLLWQCLKTIEEREGKARITDYQGSPRSSELHRLPLSEGQFNRRGFMEWLAKQPGWKSNIAFLEKIAVQCNPQAFSPNHPFFSKAEIGMWLIDADSPRDGKVATDGALAKVCESLAEAAADYAALRRRESR